MKPTLSLVGIFRGLLLFVTPLASLFAEPKTMFTDSSAALLGKTKRVVISSVMVSFQASTGSKDIEKGSIMNLLAPSLRSKSDAVTVLQWPDIDHEMASGIVEGVYRQLQADLTEAGFEVVPEATLLTSANYKKIQEMAGIPNFSKFANKAGDTLLVGPKSLPLYVPYGIEIGPFGNAPHGYMSGWISAFGKSSTPGGPTVTKLSDVWGLPALEVALAKELNAHVVKATYLVTLGTTTTKVAHSYGTTVDSNAGGKVYTKEVNSSGTANVQVGIFPLQSRIAFRTPDGNARWQTAPRFKDAPPAKDGDVVVTLAEPVLGGTEFFELTSEKKEKSKGLFGGGAKADTEFNFTATITDKAGYAAELSTLLRNTQKALLAPVKR